MDETSEPIITEQRLPWHKPEIQRLTISVDTRLGNASNPDQDGAEP